MANCISSTITDQECKNLKINKGLTLPWKVGDVVTFLGTHSMESTNGNAWMGIQIRVFGTEKTMSAAQLVRAGNGIYKPGDNVAKFLNTITAEGNTVTISNVERIPNNYGSFSTYLSFKDLKIKSRK